jgi:hypothetical protein
MAFTIINSYDNERWDSLALRVYGDATRQADLIDANPQILFEEVLPGGTPVIVPIDLTAVMPSTSTNGNSQSGPGLPPWMQ